MKTFWTAVALCAALLAGSAHAGTSFCTISTSPPQCNGTRDDVKITICHSRGVGWTKSVDVGLSGAGLTAKAGMSGTATVNQSGCAQADVPPGKCLFYEYKVLCETYTVTTFFFFTEVHTECQTISSTVMCEPASEVEG